MLLTNSWRVCNEKFLDDTLQEGQILGVSSLSAREILRDDVSIQDHATYEMETNLL